MVYVEIVKASRKFKAHAQLLGLKRRSTSRLERAYSLATQHIVLSNLARTVTVIYPIHIDVYIYT